MTDEFELSPMEMEHELFEMVGAAMDMLRDLARGSPTAPQTPAEVAARAFDLLRYGLAGVDQHLDEAELDYLLRVERSFLVMIAAGELTPNRVLEIDYILDGVNDVAAGMPGTNPFAAFEPPSRLI